MTNKERAAQIWCHPKLSDRVMDVEMALVIAEALDEVEKRGLEIRDAQHKKDAEEIERLKAELKKELHDSNVYITRSETVVKELELRAQAAEDVALHWYTVWAEMTKPVGAYKYLPTDIQEEIEARVAELKETSGEKGK